jgi:hypothetical protein
MRTRYLCSLWLIAALAWPLASRAQSLAEVARAEEARRKNVKQPAKVYTNDDLKRPGDASAPPPAPAQPAAGTTAAGAKPAGAAKDPTKPDAAKPDQPAADTEPKKDEKYWRDRITTARDAMTHDKVLLDALQSRVNALTTDFTNMSDPAQRAVIENNRKTALAEIDRVTKDMEKQNKVITDIQEEARKASVPPGWLR